jgi:beta-glucanase (GH16 family)
MSLRASRFRITLACATVALGLLWVAVLPASEAGAGRHGKAAATNTCKKKGKSAAKKCKGLGSQDSPRLPSAPSTQPQTQTVYAAQAPGPDACGTRIAKGPGAYWDCTFSENFNGTSLDRSKWVPQRTATSGYFHGPDACFVDSANNISVSGGTLRLTARKEPAPFDCGGGYMMRYTSGMVSTAMGRFSQAYGRFEVRAKVSSARIKGLQTALWLWPVNAAKYGSYPASGEIDIAEMFSQYPDRAIPFIHYNQATSGRTLTTNNYCMISNLAEFHTYTLEWTATTMKISYDGKTCLIHAFNPASPLQGSQPFDQPFFIALTQALGVGTNAFDPAATPLPAMTEVDYVRVWK